MSGWAAAASIPGNLRGPIDELQIKIISAPDDFMPESRLRQFVAMFNPAHGYAMRHLPAFYELVCFRVFPRVFLLFIVVALLSIALDHQQFDCLCASR